MSVATRLALCIPAFNAALHLPRLMASVRAQTEPFDEILLHDDASTDDTVAVAASFGVRVVTSAVNAGASVGKNRLAAAATAAWVHFHDADDALAPEFVASARRWIDADTADVVLFATQDRDDLSGVPLLGRAWDAAALERDAVAYCIAHTVTNCGIYRRSAFVGAGGFDTRPEIRYNEDQAMHLRLALRGLRFSADPYAGVVIYRRAGSMSSGNPIGCARAQLEVLAQAAEATGTRYADAIGARLWTLAGALGGYEDWAAVHRCLDLAAALGYTRPASEHPAIRLMARVSPYGAVRLREAFIRALKPQLRRGMPTVR